MEDKKQSSKGKDDKDLKKKKVKSEKIVDYNSSDEEAKETKDVKSNFYEVEKAKDYYCSLCRSQMNSDLTWSTHINGKRHIKKLQQSNFATQRRLMPSTPDANRQQVKAPGGPLMIPTRDTREIAQIQAEFNQVIDKPLIGLDFVKEIWLLDETAEPVYHCSLCKADCQRITILEHVIGYRHRMNYLKWKEEARYEKFSKSSEKRTILSDELLREALRMEKIYGRGSVTVSVEVEDHDTRDMDYSSSSNDYKEHVAEKKTPIKPEKAPKKKIPSVSVEMLVAGTSTTTVVSKFTELSDAERLKVLEGIDTLPYIPLNEKEKELETLKKMQALYVRQVLRNCQSKSERAEEYSNGNFDFTKSIINDLCGKAFFKPN